MDDLMATCANAAADLRCLLPSMSRTSVDSDFPFGGNTSVVRVKQESVEEGVGLFPAINIKKETDADDIPIVPIKWIVENGIVGLKIEPQMIKEEPTISPLYNRAGTVATPGVVLGVIAPYYSTAFDTPESVYKPILVQPDRQGPPPAKKLFVCVTCGTGFSQRRSLATHQKLHSVDAARYGLLKATQGRKQQRGGERRDGEARLRCSSCGKCFSKATQLSRHEKTHSRERRYQCAHCSQWFISACKLASHQKSVHASEQIYRCPTCGKIFARPNYLTSHQKIHSGEKPYRCGVCGKSFTYAHHVTRHERSHTGEKPYKCATCGKAFAWPHNVTKHQRVHTGERPYSCAACGNTFAQLHHLVLHQRIHTGEKPYKCEACGKAFTQLNQLVRHRRVHTGEKPYNCEYCAKSFASASNLNAHRRTHRAQTTAE